LDLWKLISTKRNREIITWLAAGAATIISGVWTAYIFLAPFDHRQDHLDKAPPPKHFGFQRTMQ
jgi:hypothetical protein